MSMNKFMHPRNIYRTPPNFKELALKYPEFRKYAQNKLDGGISFDFKNPEALRYLTTILLKKDFNLDVHIPEEKLVPTLPLRLNYILWLEDVLEWKPETNSSVKGIDIGTGATCIFPLLAAKKNGWKMLGTEINKSSIDIANENIRKNSLQDYIIVKEVSESTFLDGIFDETETFDFCMCNPPFFSNEDDLNSNHKARTSKRKEPSNCQTGVCDEIISPGGEVEFIRNIIRDSLKLRDRIKIYTTMMGHKSSLEILIRDLQNDNITYSQTMFCQGHTVRWALAWSFFPITLKDFLPPTHKKVKPITWNLEPKFKYIECVEMIPRLLTSLKIQFKLIESYKKRSLWKIVAHENTWTGLRRKRREQKRLNKIEDNSTEDSNKMDINTEISPNDSITSNTSNNSTNDIEMHLDSNFTENLSNKRSLDEDESVSVKKIKINHDRDILREPLIEALLSLHTAKNNTIDLQITYVSGSREAPQQLMQYLKNNLL